MTLCTSVGGDQSDLFSNSSGERLAEIGRHGGGIPPRFLGEEAESPANAEGEFRLWLQLWSGPRSAVTA
jgi:hypothetical protein